MGVEVPISSSRSQAVRRGEGEGGGAEDERLGMASPREKCRAEFWLEPKLDNVFVYRRGKKTPMIAKKEKFFYRRIKPNLSLS